MGPASDGFGLGLTEMAKSPTLNATLCGTGYRMRRRIAVLICLFLASAGPMASQARVAYGLAKSLSEVGHNVIEPGQEVEDEAYDGQDIVTMTADVATGLDAPQALPFAFGFLTPGLALYSSLEDGPARPLAGRVYWPPPLRQRLASLQTFLI